MNIIGITVLTCCLIGLVIIFYCKTKKIDIWSNNKYIILLVYGILLIFLSCKMCYYQFYVGSGLDEPAHIGYVAYLEKESKLIPDFKKMHGLVKQERKQDEDNPEYDIEWKLPTTKTIKMKESLSLNYLGHPPLFYHILRLTKGIKFNNDGSITVILHRLRTGSSYFIIFGFVILFYMGYNMLPKKVMVNLFFGCFLVSIPNIAYVGAMVNNDSMAFFTISFFLCGLYRLLDEKADYLSYIFLVFGGCFSFLTKLTAGLLVLIIFGAVIGYFFFIKKDYTVLFNRKVLILLPVIFLTISYFIYIYISYGSIQASYQVIAPEQYVKSPFYVNNTGDNEYTFLTWLYHFIKDFFKSSIVISRFHNVEKLRFYEMLFCFKHFMFSWIWVMPIVLLNKKLRKKMDKFLPLYCAVVISFLGTFAMHTITGYRGYVAYGRYGGANSRYYLGISSVFILAFINYLEKVVFDKRTKLDNVYKIRDIIYFLLSILVVYQDIGVYLLEHCIL